jgi:hypothetical protein
MVRNNASYLVILFKLAHMLMQAMTGVFLGHNFVAIL